MTTIRDRGLSALVAISTILLLVALGIAPFFTGTWIYPAQDRTGAEALTGWPPTTVHDVTGRVVGDLLLGPGRFDQTVDGRAVFDEAEASHLRDVRHVVLAFGGVALLAAVVLLVVGAIVRTPVFWPAVRAGASVLAVVVVALAVFALVAFDTAFELFHRLFFAAGTYSFDPATSRLVRLFPEAFWSQTAMAIGGFLIALALVTRALAGRARTAAWPTATGIRSS
ncbi:MAG TPA: DUF1461 domain-containing protein [Candidatus Dormibacteraeota bacterium]|nr:DUF1461 domain-containing protein [Candidatus Dormibacteraeota bacterium]